MKFWDERRRDVVSNTFVALCAGSYVGGVVFNILGTGSNLQNAIVGFGLMVFFFLCAIITKGGK